MKKIIAILLSVVMILSCASVAVFADDNDLVIAPNPTVDVTPETVAQFATDLHIKDIIRPLSNISFASKDAFGDSMLKVLYGIADFLIDNIVSVLNYFVPSVEFVNESDYEATNFYKGTDTFLKKAAEGAQWSVGYASASLQTGNELDGKHYVGGSLSLNKAATSIKDDQRVRVVCLDDGSGRGTVAFATLDAFGLPLPDVREIRSRLEEFAKINNIISINISVLHQHSCVDTLGMNGNILEMLAKNPITNIINSLTGSNKKLVNGQNEEFMENLFTVTATAIREAYADMQKGTIYYSEIDAAKFIHDKREPMVYDTDIHRFRFVPDDTSAKETWLCNSAIHCVGNGAAGTDITGDYPYYMEQVINEAGANFMLIQGAELAITSDNDPVIEKYGDMDRIDRLCYYGAELGKLVVESTAEETVVEPVLNLRFMEYKVPVTNQILIFAAKMGLVTNLALETANGIEVVTEIGYMEIGDKLAVAIIPGELESAIAYGGCLDASNSYRGEGWDYPSMQDIVGKDKDLLVFGLTNDQIGYILSDNDYSSIVSGVNEEIVATGDKAGSSTITAFEELVNSIK